MTLKQDNENNTQAENQPKSHSKGGFFFFNPTVQVGLISFESHVSFASHTIIYTKILYLFQSAVTNQIDRLMFRDFHF